jgi:hypothetical protein
MVLQVGFKPQANWRHPPSSILYPLDLIWSAPKVEALAHPGSNIAGLFVYTAPCFYFNHSQRSLLQRALMGQTCERLATSLSISPWTVKKRWHAIYDRVADVDGELLSPQIAYGAHVSLRGAERRRHLLKYLRQHLEELRPCKPPKYRMGHWRREDYGLGVCIQRDNPIPRGLPLD